MHPSFLPYGRQQIDDDDVDAVITAVRGDYLTTGPAVSALEGAFAEFSGAKHAIACANGTAALHICAMAMRFQPGDAVIVPTVTFLATATAPHLSGALPIFADVAPDTGLMRVQDMLDAVERAESAGLNVRAVFPVHLNGRCVDVGGLRQSLSSDVTIVEDACHAVGGRDAGGAPVGSCTSSDMATFSLHPVKAFTSAEGGIVTCNDDRVEKELRLLINHGMIREAGDFVATDQALDAEGTTNPWYYELQSPGLNYRLNDVSCALGRSQLRKLPDFIERRRQLVGHYRECLCSAAVEEIRWIADGHQTAIGWHLFVVLIDFEGLKTSRAEVMRELSRVGVGSQVHYLPVHRQPYYRTLDESLHLPGADRYYERCLSLPLFPAMDESHVERVVEQLVRIVKNPRL